MPMFVTIGYGDEAGYAGITAAVRDAAHQRDAQLRAGGALVGIAGKAVQVRNPDAAGMRVDEGAFMRSDLPVAGFGVIEADDIDDAIRLVSGTPCAVAHGVVEIWPLTQPET